MGLAPDVAHRGFELVFGMLSQSTSSIGDALCLLRAAIDITARSRGFVVQDAQLLVGTDARPLNGSAHRWLDAASAAR
jgi:hypothetical protein